VALFRGSGKPGSGRSDYDSDEQRQRIQITKNDDSRTSMVSTAVLPFVRRGACFRYNHRGDTGVKRSQLLVDLMERLTMAEIGPVLSGASAAAIAK